jgi:hypothetical protein
LLLLAAAVVALHFVSALPFNAAEALGEIDGVFAVFHADDEPD